MQNRRWGYVISGALTVVALLAVVILSLNYGIDFAGGTLWSLRFEEPVAEQQLGQLFADHGLDSPVVQQVESTASGYEYVVRTPFAGEEKRQEVLAALGDAFGEFTLVSFDDVSPSIGVEIQSNALKALLFAIAGMIIYITLRFEYRFAVTAIVALFHDIIMMIGVFALFQFEVDTTFVAAILTIFGYSVNDTIIIYDRIRENRRYYRRDQLLELVNDSVNQTLARTINTSLTTILAIGAVAQFGGETLRPFAIALVVGIVVGTYSSIFVASSLWLDWSLRGASRRLQNVKAPS